MAADFSACLELQTDELSVLESIYPGLVHVHPNPSSRPGQLLTLAVPVTLPAPITIVLASSSASLTVSHLPPLTLRVILPTAYPLTEPPRPIAVRAALSAEHHVDWLSRDVTRKVKDQLASMWAEEQAAGGEGAGVLWKWCDWVGTGDFLHDVGLRSGDAVQLPIHPMIPQSTIFNALKSYNAAQLHSSFANTAFSCSICFENRKGKSCVELPCSCVFCTPCLYACWSLAITEGSLENVSCPSVGCTKSRATQESVAAGRDSLDPGLVEGVVGLELRDRWLSLKERRRAEIDPTYTTCPRPTCQAPVPPPPKPTAAELAAQASAASRAIRLADLRPSIAPVAVEATPADAPPMASEDRWERYRQCPACHFSFCLYCSATWHGPHTPCAFPQMSGLVQEYLSYPEGSADRRRMEAQRGRGNLERMVRQWEEDESNRKWLEDRTRACAGCGVRVEKSHGCNHMTCGRCNAHFCYRCGDSISPQDPYAHYRRPGHACFEKLFDQDEIARFEREMNTAGGNAVADDFEWREVRGIWEW